MTEITSDHLSNSAPSAEDKVKIERIRANIAGRRGSTQRLRIYGIVAIAFALSMLGILIASVISTSWTAWTQTQVRLDVSVPAGDDLPTPGRMIDTAVLSLFPETDERAARRAITGIVSDGAQYYLRDVLAARAANDATVISLWVPVTDPYEQLYEGVIDPSVPEARRPLNDDQIGRFTALEEAGRIRSIVDWNLWTGGDSRFPELAGLWGAIVGSIYLLAVCAALSIPLGIGAAIYLEEYAPKNKFTDFIEINVNNLAAVPSIVYGLLGLALFLGFLGMPRSAPLVGGMVVALMTLPTIIITTRSALKAVPPSIREAARGIGASNMQVTFHHVLPLALPGILTGVIIGMAAALGETGPLLLIGMNAFITSAPDTLLSPSTTLPTQIYIWFDSPERGFVARTSAGICVLLVFLTVMNFSAILLRRRFERRW